MGDSNSYVLMPRRPETRTESDWNSPKNNCVSIWCRLMRAILCLTGQTSLLIFVPIDLANTVGREKRIERVV